MTEITTFCFVLLALTVFVAAPLYAHHEDGDSSGRGADEAAEARERLRVALRELEVDRAGGLLDEASYRTERAALEALHADGSCRAVD